MLIAVLSVLFGSVILDQLTKAMHTDALTPEDTLIRIDYKNSGVGSNSCGPELPEPYRLSEKHIDRFEFYISL